MRIFINVTKMEDCAREALANGVHNFVLNICVSFYFVNEHWRNVLDFMRSTLLARQTYETMGVKGRFIL